MICSVVSVWHMAGMSSQWWFSWGCWLQCYGNQKYCMHIFPTHYSPSHLPPSLSCSPPDVRTAHFPLLESFLSNSAHSIGWRAWWVLSASHHIASHRTFPSNFVLLFDRHQLILIPLSLSIPPPTHIISQSLLIYVYCPHVSLLNLSLLLYV